MAANWRVLFKQIDLTSKTQFKPPTFPDFPHHKKTPPERGSGNTEPLLLSVL
jgi:hypothetical protein